MSGLRSSVGLISGLDIAGIVDSLMSIERQSVVRLEKRVERLTATQSGIGLLQASLLSLGTSAQTLADARTFQTFNVANSDTAQLRATTRSGASAGTHQFQALRKAATHQVVSRGFANANQQAVGSGTLAISTGGKLARPTLLELMNGGAGVRLGKIKITDRGGSSAEIDLTNAVSMQDVLDQINSASGISVTASTSGGSLVLTDISGATAANLSVVELAGGSTAADLGILQSVAADTLSGSAVYSVTGDFTLNLLDDGNQLRFFNGAPDIRVTLSDDSQLEINLDGSVTLSDVLQKINDHADNNGKLAASLVDGRIQLIDQSGGGGAGSFLVEDINDSTVVRGLGLNVTAAGDTLTGNRLTGGLNSVLLRNLRGGRGIEQSGQIALTDRTGATTTIDLSGAESLDEVINAINTAATGGGQKLTLRAELNAGRTGLIVRDTSGAAASNLIVADLGGGTLAADLGIAVDAAQSSIDSGTLSLRRVNEATSLAKYAPNGGAVGTGSFSITDSAGNVAVINLTTSVKTIGDVLQRINAASNISVTARLNDTGDGFVLVDEAGGAGTLEVRSLSGSAAADLRMLGTAELDGDGKYRVSSRLATIVKVAAEDTLETLVQKINAAGNLVRASVFNDGSSFNPTRLSLVSGTAGAAGELIIDDGGLGLGWTTTTQAQDSLLRVGGNPATAFLVTSSSNTFKDAAPGVDVEVLAPGAQLASVTLTLDTARIRSALNGFVTNYNAFRDRATELTKFDLEANQRGVLQGNGIVLRTQMRMDNLLRTFTGNSGDPIRSLTDLGISVRADGKLGFNGEVFDQRVADHGDKVSEFFLKAETGLAKRLDGVLKSLNDPLQGTFKIETTALQNSVDGLNRRIEQLDEILVVRRERLLRQFVAMEGVLSAMSSQQQALSALQTRIGQQNQ